MLELLLGAMVPLTVAGSLFVRWYLRGDARIKRALRGVRPTPIADVTDGKVVKIVGELVYAGRSIPSGLFERPCALYSLVIEQYRRYGTRGGHWHSMLRQHAGVDFYVRDATGLALIRIGDDKATLLPALVWDRRARTSPILANSPELERFLTARGISVGGTIFRKNLRAWEGVLEAGERVAIGGLARWLPDPDAAGGNYRELPKRLVLEGSEALPLLISDDPAAI